MLAGKKTYIVAIVMILYNGLGMYLQSVGQTGLGSDAAINGILTALGLIGLRMGLPKPTP